MRPKPFRRFVDCPKCGWSMHTVDTTHDPKFVRRKRRCTNTACRFKAITKEIYESDANARLEPEIFEGLFQKFVAEYFSSLSRREQIRFFEKINIENYETN